MKIIYNKETGKKHWTLFAWYEKVFYVVGAIYVSLLVLGFCGGVLQALAR